MVGLISAITMSVLERTREIGVLRCIGARGPRHPPHLRGRGPRARPRSAGSSGSRSATARPLLIWLFGRLVGIEIPFVFPPPNIGYALAGTLVLAVLVMLLPVRRAVPLQAGRRAALRLAGREASRAEAPESGRASIRSTNSTPASIDRRTGQLAATFSSRSSCSGVRSPVERDRDVEPPRRRVVVVVHVDETRRRDPTPSCARTSPAPSRCSRQAPPAAARAARERCPRRRPPRARR